MNCPSDRCEPQGVSNKPGTFSRGIVQQRASGGKIELVENGQVMLFMIVIHAH